MDEQPPQPPPQPRTAFLIERCGYCDAPHLFSRRTLEQRIKDLEAEAKDLDAEIERLKAERDEATKQLRDFRAASIHKPLLMAAARP